MLLPITGRMAEWPEHQVGTGALGPLGSRGGTSASMGTPFAVGKLLSMNNPGSEKLRLHPPRSLSLSSQVCVAGKMLCRATKHFI